ncbi:hypothetical protein GRH90_18935 [Enterobacteriales bacterium SAP-6]|uniref:Uncharacterized protein n=2 Tax=Acerihabitans arboris TaxID=2691583 RepID=A0A845SV11_9GAMM|nr:hypothetical protein [Acerihabitans arboris]
MSARDIAKHEKTWQDAAAAMDLLLTSEIADFSAGLGNPGEPETPEAIQDELMRRTDQCFAVVHGKRK